MLVWSLTMPVTFSAWSRTVPVQRGDDFGPPDGQVPVEIDRLLHVLEVPGDRLGQINLRDPRDHIGLLGELLDALLEGFDRLLGELAGLARGGGVGPVGRADGAGHENSPVVGSDAGPDRMIVAARRHRPVDDAVPRHWLCYPCGRCHRC